jgi:hypothetical protein
MKEPKQQVNPEQEAGTMAPQSTSKKPKGKPALGREIQAKIGQQLRAYYDALIEPTPDRFTDLLRQLDKPGAKEPTE